MPPARWVRLGPNGRLAVLRLPESSRTAGRTALYSIAFAPPEQVRAALDAAVERFPRSPHPYCYRGELSLWLGQWDDALADFERALRVEDTRWAHIGLLAAHLGRGDLHEAERAALRGDRRFPWIPASTGFVYRGELRRLQGRCDEAIADLRLSQEAQPGRIGGWINLALACAMRGDDAAARHSAHEVERRAPDVLWAAAPPRSSCLHTHRSFRLS